MPTIVYIYINMKISKEKTKTTTQQPLSYRRVSPEMEPERFEIMEHLELWWINGVDSGRWVGEE